MDRQQLEDTTSNVNEAEFKFQNSMRARDLQPKFGNKAALLVNQKQDSLVSSQLIMPVYGNAKIR